MPLGAVKKKWVPLVVKHLSRNLPTVAAEVPSQGIWWFLPPLHTVSTRETGALRTENKDCFVLSHSPALLFLKLWCFFSPGSHILLRTCSSLLGSLNENLFTPKQKNVPEAGTYHSESTFRKLRYRGQNIWEYTERTGAQERGHGKSWSEGHAHKGSTKQITQGKGVSVSWGNPSRKGGEGTEEVKETEVIFLEGHSLFCIWVSYTPLHWPFEQGCFYLTQNAVVGNLFPWLHVFMERDYFRRNYPGFWPTLLLSLPRRGEMTYLIGKQEIETGLVGRLSKCSWEWHRGEPTRLSAVFSSLSSAAIKEALLNPCANLSTGSKTRAGQRKVF